MKTRGKVLLATLSAAMLVTASVMGTLAYLQDSETVTNTFTVGKVGITLDETDVNPDGTAVPSAPRTDEGNEYKLMPGHKYTKDPIVHVEAGSEDAYLFVKIENDISAIEDPDNTIDSQMVAKGWTEIDDTNVYYYKEVVSAGANVPVFDFFMVAGNVTNDTLSTYAPTESGEKKDVTVTAYAIQADGFDTDADHATDAKAAWVAGGFTA